MPEVLERCPACRARLAGNPTCPRCGCDFSLVLQALAQAERRLDAAVACLARGKHAAAKEEVVAALAIHRQPLAVALKAFLESHPEPLRQLTD